MLREAIFYKKLNLEKNIVRCELCPHRCVINPNNVGNCLIRKNIDGKLYLTTYGEITSIAIDPIEKKPLYHFFPSKNILSIGTTGCNLKCPFCQNWQISSKKAFTEEISIEKLANLVVTHNSIGIAYTYNEPFIWYEFILDAAKNMHDHNIKNVFVTNGCINAEPLEKLLPYIDAANVDLKAFNNDFYRWVKGDLETTLQTIELLHKNNKHLELTNLVIPTKNDNPDEFYEMCKWISSLSKDIPLHISRYFPNHKLSIPPTPISTLKNFYNIAKRCLNYVYIGNVLIDDAASTYCPLCNFEVIKRSGYNTIVNIKDNKCPKCGNTLPILL
ncbi:MAG: AmmeMemoRadiSam system radical SAM enzyme [Deferribacterota bacterium]|nr:AmmeMemoRadiSam system radical SAM enzyme [Deferribacterota bacterium]